jgi:hypothetical protein
MNEYSRVKTLLYSAANLPSYMLATNKVDLQRKQHIYLGDNIKGKQILVADDDC